jgi:predicted nucleotidyltransferase
VQNLNNLLQVLLKKNIDFVLIGGFAGVVHGSTQVTRDLDICAAITSNQITLLRDALKDLNPRHRMNPGHKPSFLSEPKEPSNLKNIYLETDLGILDILSSVTGVGEFEQVKKNSVEIELYGRKCRVISLEALIEAKKKMGRPKDKLLVAELEAVRRKRSE